MTDGPVAGSFQVVATDRLNVFCSRMRYLATKLIAVDSLDGDREWTTRRPTPSRPRHACDMNSR